jgi:hypothetical protein
VTEVAELLKKGEKEGKQTLIRARTKS